MSTMLSSRWSLTAGPLLRFHRIWNDSYVRGTTLLKPAMHHACDNVPGASRNRRRTGAPLPRITHLRGSSFCDANSLDFAQGICWSFLAWPNKPVHPTAGCAGHG